MRATHTRWVFIFVVVSAVATIELEHEDEIIDHNKLVREKRQVLGGWFGPVIPMEEETLIVIRKVKPQVEASLGIFRLMEFTIISYRQQVVAGMNYDAKVIIGRNHCIRIIVFYQSWTDTLELTDLYNNPVVCDALWE